MADLNSLDFEQFIPTEDDIDTLDFNQFVPEEAAGNPGGLFGGSEDEIRPGENFDPFRGIKPGDEPEIRQPVGDLRKRAMRGLTEVGAAVPESLAIAGAGNPNASALFAQEEVTRAQSQIRDAQARLADNPNMGSEARSRIAAVIAEEQRKIDAYSPMIDQAEGPLKPAAQDRPLYKRGQSVRQASLDLFGTPDHQFDDRFLSKLAEGAGNMAGFVGVTLTTGLLGGAAAGSALNTSSMYRDALSKGASEEDAKFAAYIGSAIGASEVIPIGRAFQLLPAKYRGKVANAFGRRMTDAFLSAGEEGVQEAAAEFLNNVTAQQIYDPDRGWSEGIGEAALIGAILGAPMGAIGSVPNDSAPRHNLKPGDDESPLQNEDIAAGNDILDAVDRGEALPPKNVPAAMPETQVAHDTPPAVQQRGLAPDVSEAPSIPAQPAIEGDAAPDIEVMEDLETGRQVEVNHTTGQVRFVDEHDTAPIAPQSIPEPEVQATAPVAPQAPAQEAQTAPIQPDTDAVARSAAQLPPEQQSAPATPQIDSAPVARVDAMIEMGQTPEAIRDFYSGMDEPAAREIAKEASARIAKPALLPEQEKTPATPKIETETHGQATPTPDPQVESNLDVPNAQEAQDETVPGEAVDTEAPRGIEVLTNEDIARVETDAKTFQYKGGADAEGVTDRLRDVTKWDSNRTGMGLIYEYEDGRRVVVDGHQRLGLAKRMAENGQQIDLPVRVLREADGVTESEARSRGAEKNIAEGSGTALDAAKVFRETRKTANDLNLPKSSQLVRNGDSMAKLSDDAFGMVINEVASERDAAIVGDVVKDKARHSDILGLLTRLKPANKVQAESIAHQATETEATETQTSLFGEEEVSANLYLERAKVLDRAIKDIGQDIRTFKTLVERGETITGAGNVLKGEANQTRLDADAQAKAILAKQANSKGPISDALTQAARALKDGAKIGTAAQQFIAAVRDTKEVGGNEGAGRRGTRDGDGQAQADGTGRAGVSKGRVQAQQSEVTPPNADDFPDLNFKDTGGQFGRKRTYPGFVISRNDAGKYVATREGETKPASQSPSLEGLQKLMGLRKNPYTGERFETPSTEPAESHTGDKKLTPVQGETLEDYAEAGQWWDGLTDDQQVLVLQKLDRPRVGRRNWHWRDATPEEKRATYLTFKNQDLDIWSDANSAPATEATPEGEQTLIPGVAPVSQREKLEAEMAKPKAGGNAAAPSGRGDLFGDPMDRADLFDKDQVQPSITQTLYAVHNLGAENLRHVDELGGLAAPSIAIARGDIGFDNFGEISLIGAPDMINPKGRGVKAFASDVYSPRQPRAEHDLRRSGLNKIEELLDGPAQELGADSIWQEIDQDRLSTSFMDAMEYSVAAKLAFLKSKDDAPRLVKKRPPVLEPRLKQFKGKSGDSLFSDPEFDRVGLEFAEERVAKASGKFKDRVRETLITTENGKDVPSYTLLNDLARQIEAASRPVTVDRYESGKALRKRMDKSKIRKAQFRQWIRDEFGGVLDKKFFRSERGRRKPYEMTHLVREITRTIRDGEGFNYGVGSIRSMVTPEFRNITQIKESRGKVISEEAMENLKKEANDELFALADKFAPYHGSSQDFGWGDIFSEFLKDLSRGRLREWQQGIFSEPVPDALVKEARGYLAKLADMPTEYFEIKMQRPVALSEFEAALVPASASKNTVKILQDAGLQVIRYKPDNKGKGRTEALAKVRSKVMFQAAAVSRGHARTRRPANTFREARAAVKEFQGQTLINRDSGIEAVLSRTTLDKMLSFKAVDKSETPSTHSLAVANADSLFENAVYGWNKLDDRDDTGTTTIHRLFARMSHGKGQERMVKLTVKETARVHDTNPIYTIEAVAFNEKSPADTWVASEMKADAISRKAHPTAEDVFNIAQDVENFNAGQDRAPDASTSEINFPLLRELDADMRKRLDKMMLKRVDLGFDEDMATQGKFSGDRFGNLRIVIGASFDGVASLGHESIHALRAMKLFTDSEWAKLAETAESTWMSEFDIESRYHEKEDGSLYTREEQIEEAIAEGMGQYLSKRHPDSLINSAIAKVKRFFRALREALAEHSIASVEDIFYDAAEGRIGARQGNDRFAGNQAMAAAQAPVLDTNSTAFKRWFGDSKVVDENGDPLAVYHGSDAERDIIEPGRRDPGAWFSTSSMLASNYVHQGGYLHEVFLKVENPLVVPFDMMDGEIAPVINGDVIDISENEQFGTNVGIVQFAEANGYDGVHFPDGNFSEDSETWVVFESDAIKSTSNRGTFDPNDPRILYQEQEVTSKEQRQPSRAARAQIAINSPQEAHIPDRNVWEELADHNKGMFDRVKGAKGAAWDQFDAFRTKLQDRMLPMLRAEQAIERKFGQKISKKQSAYYAEERYSGRVGRRFDQIDEGYTRPVIRLISEADTPLSVTDKDGKKRTDAEAASLYLMARHAKERNAHIASINPKMPDGGSGLTNAQAASILAEAKLGPNADRFNKIGKLMDRLGKEMIDLREASGLLSPQDAQMWRAMYKHYIPLQGFAETDMFDATLNEGRGSGLGGRRFNVKGQEGKRAMGRTSEAFDPLSAMITQAQEVAVRSEKNIVSQTLYNLVHNNPSKAMWEVITPPTKRFFNSKTGLVEDRVVGVGMEQLGPNEMALKIRGKERRIVFHDPRLAEAMGSVGTHGLAGALKPLSALSRYFSATNTMLSPPFVIVNAIRDMTTAQVNLGEFAGKDAGKIRKSALKNWIKSRRGASDAMKGNLNSDYAKWFREFEAAGAKVHFWNLENAEAQQADIQNRIDLERGGTLKKLRKLNTRDNPALAWIERVNLSVDNAVRLASYVEARKQGWTKEDAASLSKNLTVNFNRRGEWGANMNALYPFANAAVQGTEVMLRAMKGKQVKGIVGSMVIFGLLNDLLNAEMSEEDDDGELEYDKIPGYISERNLILRYGGGDSAVTVPLPYGYNVFFHAGQQLGKVVRGVKGPGDALGEMFKSMFTAFSPVNGESLSQTLNPLVFDVVNEFDDNRNWQDRPIRPENPYGDYGPQSYKAYNATEVSRLASKGMNTLTGGSVYEPGMIDISPEYLDHAVSLLAGGAGRFAMRTYGLGEKLATGQADQVQAYQIPLARVLYYQNSDWLDQGRYFDFREIVKDARAQEKLSWEPGMPPLPGDIAAKAGLYEALKPAEKARKEIGGKLDAVYADETLSPRQRNAKLKPLLDERAKVYLDFNAEFIEEMGPQAE